MKHRPFSALAVGIAGAVLVVLLAHPVWASPSYKILHQFGKSTDGAGPYGVTLGADGALYGTTPAGGTGQGCNGYGCGTVFQMTRQRNGTWTETVLYSFPGTGQDGYWPRAQVIQDAARNLYGTTSRGGAYDVGTVFEAAPRSGGWAESVLYSFGTQPNSGGEPRAGLVTDGAGNLYGTAGGGAYNCGVVFELTRGSDGWEETVLYAFGGSTPNDGCQPYASVIFDPDGNLCGTTTAGGGYSCGSASCGTVYELTPTSGGGWKEIILHRFRNSRQDGSWPDASLLRDARGNLYGTATNGGTHGGVVFELTPKAKGRWKETILYDFQGGADGWLPSAGVVMDKSGNLYGTTDGGGWNGCGVIYKLAPLPKGQWTYTVLHTFYGIDGCSPAGNLIIDKKGNLYGGTVLGGDYGGGVVFELTP